MATVPSAPQVTRRRLGRTLLGLCIGCTGLLILGLTLLPDILTLERVQRALVSHVEAALQRRVTVGAVRLQLLSGLEVTLEDVTIDTPPGWAHSHFLRVGTLSLQVAPLALLQRTIAITKMIVRDAELVIERDPHGRLNVTDPATSAIAQILAPSHEAAPAEVTHSGVMRLASWPVADVVLEGVTVTFVDRMRLPGEVVTTAVRDVRGHLHGISRNMPIPFDLTAAALSDGHRNLRMWGHIGPMPAPWAIGKAAIEADLHATDLLLGALAPYLGGRFPLERGSMGADLKVHGMMGGSLHIAGVLTLVEGVWRDPTRGEAIVVRPMLVSTEETTLDLANASIQITEAQLAIFGLHATLTGTVTDVRKNPRFDLHLVTTAFPPGDLLPQIPPLAPIIPAPAEWQGRAQLQATVSGTPHALRANAQIEVNDVALKSGGLHVETDTAHISLAMQLEKPGPPQVHLDLHAHRLVIDQRESHAALSAATPPGSTPRAPQAHKSLPPVTLNGTVEIAEGRIQRLGFQQLTADVALAQGRLTATHQATLYGGSYRGAAQMHLVQGEPAYTLNARLVGVQLGAAMRPWTPANPVRQGVLSTQITLSGRGWTWPRLRQTLRGNGHATISKLKTRPADPLHVRTHKVTIVNPLGNLTRYIRVKHGSIHTVKTTLHMNQGHIFSDALQLWGQEVAVQAKGYVGLDRSVTYNGTLTLSGGRASAQGVLAKLFLRDAHGRIIYPFTIRGTVSDPQITVNAKDVLGRAVEGLTGAPK